jgi:glycerophosphoryl diester phosphodiesterase
MAPTQTSKKKANTHLRDELTDLLMAGVDCVMSFIPFSRPAKEVLMKTKVIAHRGSCEGGAKENTLLAFRAASDAGVWGIELDLRWTTDNVPVVSHDQTAERVFGDATSIASLTSSEIRARLPLIPTLAEVLSEFGGERHLMIELKETLNEEQSEVLRDCLSRFEPGQDYHIISLQLEVLLKCKIVPRSAMVPIAEFNVAEMSRGALEHKMAGVAGQYLLVTSKTVESHQKANQQVGTGFIRSRSVLYREVNRGVDWIFTNRAREIMSYLQS